jgi:hypothetical protein
MVLNRELVSGPLFHRSALLLGAGAARVEQTALGLRLQLANGESFECDAVNVKRGLNRLVLYNWRFGSRTLTPEDGFEIVLDQQGRALATSSGNTQIPRQGWVISGHGQAAEWLSQRVKVGDRVAVTQTLLERWQDVQHVLGAGPRLVERGELKVQSAAEKFSPDVIAGRAPRTAAGVDASGRLLLLAVEGRYPPRSAGLTLEGLGRLMLDLGVSDALNLDGGGSTQMVVEDQLVTRPPDGYVRPVNNALLIFFVGTAVHSNGSAEEK